VARNEPLSAEQRAPQSERLPEPQRKSPEWNGVGAERFAGPFVTLRQSRTQNAAWVEQLRGHTADYLLKTIGEDQRIRYFIAAVCRRRWPSGGRPQAPQRPTDLRTSATVIFLTRGMPETGDAAEVGVCGAKRSLPVRTARPRHSSRLTGLLCLIN
jgi:hypothetical protein